MAVGEFTQYVSVFISSLAGAVSGYFYFNAPDNLRIKLERGGTKLLRPSDPLWMYQRSLRQKATDFKKHLDQAKGLQAVIGEDFKNLNGTGPKDDTDTAYKLLVACSKALSSNNWHSSWLPWIEAQCGYPVK